MARRGSASWRLSWAAGGLLAAAAAVAAAPSAPLPPRFGDVQFTAVGAGSVPRGVVASLARDRAGFLWIGSGDGLLRFDGRRFVPRGLDAEDASGPAANLGWIRAMLGTRDGRLWIGTESDGLAYYDPAADRIRRLATGPRTVQPTVRALAEDADGALWVGSFGGGLARIAADGTASRWQHGPGAGALPDDRVLALAVDREGTLWVGTWRGLVRRPRGGTAFEPVLSAPGEPLDGRPVQALLAAADGALWIGTSEGQVLRHTPGSTAASTGGRARGAVTAFVQTVQGTVWVARSAGIDVHAADGRLQRSIAPDPTRPASLGAAEVTALLVDGGGVWVGSLGGGLQRHDPPVHGLLVREADADPHSPLAEASARHLLWRPPAAGRPGALWVALQGGGVAVLDEALRTTGRLALPAALARPGTRVQAMIGTAEGGAWLASAEHLVRLDATGTPRRLLAHRAGEVYRLLVDEDGRLWLCAEGGLHRLDPGDDTPRPAGPDGAAFAAARAPDGSLWFGGAGGLFRLAPGDDRPQAVSMDGGDGLAYPIVLGLLFDRRGGLWVDTAVAGLHRAVGEGVSVAGRPLAFDRVSVRLGAVGRPFGTNLFEDEQGRIWSQQHVYDPARDRLDELSEADGRHFGTGWFHSQARLPDGRLVFGGSRGLLVVDPARYAPARTAAPLVLTGLRVNGVARPAPPAGTRLRIEPGERSFGVEFAALDLRDPARVRYGYQLEGFDPDWTVVGADLGVAAYGNLPPGGYRLRVRTLDRGGAWGDAELGLDIEVRPAWWQRPATQGAMALALLAGVAALVQWRTRALRRQRQWLERQVAERTAALEAQSLTDPLTGLHNRRFLLQRLPLDAAASLRRHAEARRQGRPPPADADLLFFVIDLDHFKQVNDLHGHAAGDAVLSQVRERLVEAFRQADHLVRWGGEEFLIAVRDTPRARAAELAERVRRVVERTPFRLPDGRELRRTCSVGFAAFPLVGEQPDALDWAAVIDVADAALLGVKRGGRNGWMGVLSARLPAGDAALETLRAAARGPIDEWIALGGVEVQRSPGGAARSA